MLAFVFMNEEELRVSLGAIRVATSDDNPTKDHHLAPNSKERTHIVRSF